MIYFERSPPVLKNIVKAIILFPSQSSNKCHFWCESLSIFEEKACLIHWACVLREKQVNHEKLDDIIVFALLWPANCWYRDFCWKNDSAVPGRIFSFTRILRRNFMKNAKQCKQKRIESPTATKIAYLFLYVKITMEIWTCMENLDEIWVWAIIIIENLKLFSFFDYSCWRFWLAKEEDEEEEKERENEWISYPNLTTPTDGWGTKHKIIV